MGYEWRDLKGLEKPEKLEPCWRCDHPPLEVAVAEVTAEERQAKAASRGIPHGDFGDYFPAVHLCICSHCGYSVPPPEKHGFESPALAALRWNGEMLAKRMKMAEARETVFLKDGQEDEVKALHEQIRDVACAECRDLLSPE